MSEPITHTEGSTLDTLTAELRGWNYSEGMSDDARRKVWLMRRAAERIDAQAAEIARLRAHIARDMERAVNAYRAGIEAAAQWHEHEASTHYGQLDTRQADWHVFCAAAIRALADEPAPDAARGG